jgi:hypothetical protein
MFMPKEKKNIGEALSAKKMGIANGGVKLSLVKCTMTIAIKAYTLKQSCPTLRVFCSMLTINNFPVVFLDSTLGDGSFAKDRAKNESPLGQVLSGPGAMESRHAATVRGTTLVRRASGRAN